MDLSIIIVNWNSKDYLFKAIASVEADTKGIDFEMVVIDGGSFDGCAEMLRQVYPHIVFIQRDKNLGFAKANNEAFKVSRGRTLLFLNPDTEVEGHAVTTLYDQLNILPDVGMVGPKLLNSDRSLQQSCIRAFPTILNQVLESDLLRAMFPTSELWGMRPLLERDEKAKEVEAISGACLMIKKSVFEEVGMFSTDYFMYSEDIDLSLKVRRAGLKTYYVPTAVVVHHGGGSTAQGCVNTFSSVLMLESRWRVFQKTRSVWYTRSYRLAMFITCVVRVGLVLFIWPIWRLRRKGSWGQAVLTKWMAKLRWTLGRESWVKDY